MPYIDYAYYTDDFKGVSVSAEEFDRLVRRASDKIDSLTSYVLHRADFTQLAQLIQENVKKATAAQVEYLVTLGGELAVHGDEPSSVSISNFSYSTESEGKGPQTFSPVVLEYLRPTGLLYRGVNAI
jgi:hypothetical protein